MFRPYRTHHALPMIISDFIIAFNEVSLQLDQFDLEFTQCILIDLFRDRWREIAQYRLCDFLAHVISFNLPKTVLDNSSLLAARKFHLLYWLLPRSKFIIKWTQISLFLLNTGASTLPSLTNIFQSLYQLTFTSCLPRFSPANNPIKALGAFSNPSTMFSTYFNLFSFSQCANRRITSSNRSA